MSIFVWDKLTARRRAHRYCVSPLQRGISANCNFYTYTKSCGFVFLTYSWKLISWRLCSSTFKKNACSSRYAIPIWQSYIECSYCTQAIYSLAPHCRFHRWRWVITHIGGSFFLKTTCLCVKLVPSHNLVVQSVSKLKMEKETKKLLHSCEPILKSWVLFHWCSTSLAYEPW